MNNADGRLVALDRMLIEQLVETLMSFLDRVDGDPDIEDATDLEDDFVLSPHAQQSADGPGCRISDTPEYSGDEHDGTNAEDEVLCSSFMQGFPSGPGCPLSDPGGCDEGY